jgi:hypothetical protein
MKKHRVFVSQSGLGVDLIFYFGHTWHAYHAVHIAETATAT